MAYNYVSLGAVSRCSVLLFVAWSMSLPAISRNVSPVTYSATNAVTFEDPADTVSGLHYAYYEGVWAALPDFSTLTPVEEGTVPAPSVEPRHREDDFAFVYSGYITVPTNGKYTFYVNSDDGSRLLIDNMLVVSNDTLHEERERSGNITLTTGKHALKLFYFQHQTLHAISLSFSGPGITKQAIPSSSFTKPDDSSNATVTLEAETAKLSPGIRIMTDYSGYTGSGFVNYMHASGDTVKWTAFIPNAGSYKLTFRYALATAAQNVVVNINSKTINPSFAIPSTLAWGTWKEISIKADLKVGLNTIVVADAGDGGPNLDHLVIEKWEEVVTGIEDSFDRQSSISLYPNPTSRQLFIDIASGGGRAVNVSVLNAQGSLVKSQAYTVRAEDATTLTLDMSDLVNGLYRLRVVRGGQTEFRNVIVLR